MAQIFDNTDQLNRLMRSGVNEGALVNTVKSLREPRVLCSMGLVTGVAA